jgi:hypothetical protein
MHILINLIRRDIGPFYGLSPGGNCQLSCLNLFQASQKFSDRRSTGAYNDNLLKLHALFFLLSYPKAPMPLTLG